MVSLIRMETVVREVSRSLVLVLTLPERAGQRIMLGKGEKVMGGSQDGIILQDLTSHFNLYL